MTVSKVAPILLHEDQTYLREAVEFTAAVTGFPSRLIEKDYFCTVLLQHMAALDAELVFKGGTSLAKVHAEFYRLSEHIDFAIPTALDASRAERSRRARNFKGVVERIDRELPGIRVTSPMKGASNSTQYIAVVGYSSLVSPEPETIKIEVGLREPLLIPSAQAEVRTLLLDPVSELALVPPPLIECLSWEEAMAEKFRAALSRRDVAVRDFYDIDHAVHRLGFPALEQGFLELVRSKLAVPGNEPIDVSAGRLNDLRLQVDPELRPVLRVQDFAEFNLERAFAKVAEVAVALER